MSKKALITGITGQDRSYLTEFLLEKGYKVHGMIRRSSSFNTNRIDHLYKNPETYGDKFFLHYSDVTDTSNISRLLENIEPSEIYNLAAQSHVKVSFEVPEYTAEVDAVGTLRFLDAIRETGITTKFYQASTSITGNGDGKDEQREEEKEQFKKKVGTTSGRSRKRRKSSSIYGCRTFYFCYVTW